MSSHYFNRRLFGNKSLEVGYQTGNLDEDVNGGAWFKTQGDHAGFEAHLAFGQYIFEFNITDDRHWDYESNTFCVYPSTDDE